MVQDHSQETAGRNGRAIPHAAIKLADGLEIVCGCVYYTQRGVSLRD